MHEKVKEIYKDLGVVNDSNKCNHIIIGCRPGEGWTVYSALEHAQILLEELEGMRTMFTHRYYFVDG